MCATINLHNIKQSIKHHVIIHKIYYINHEVHLVTSKFTCLVVNWKLWMKVRKLLVTYLVKLEVLIDKGNMITNVFERKWKCEVEVGSKWVFWPFNDYSCISLQLPNWYCTSKFQNWYCNNQTPELVLHFQIPTSSCISLQPNMTKAWCKYDATIICNWCKIIQF